MSMPTGKQPEAGPFARAISAEFRSVIGRRQMSGQELANLSGLSRSYLTKRLRDEAAFTANDIEAICGALELSHMGVLHSAVRAAALDKRRHKPGQDGNKK